MGDDDPELLRGQPSSFSVADDRAAGSETYVPTVDDIEILRNQLAIAAENAPKPVRKALAQALVHELRVEERNEVRPTFPVHRELP